MSIDYLEKVKEIIEINSEICTEWECDFIENIYEKIMKNYSLSDKQMMIIDRIYEKACKSNY